MQRLFLISLFPSLNIFKCLWTVECRFSWAQVCYFLKKTRGQQSHWQTQINKLKIKKQPVVNFLRCHRLTWKCQRAEMRVWGAWRHCRAHPLHPPSPTLQDLCASLCRPSPCADSGDQRAAAQLSASWVTASAERTLRRSLAWKIELWRNASEEGRMFYFFFLLLFCRWILCKSTVWQVQFMRWCFHRHWKPPALASIRQIFQKVPFVERK